MPRRCRWSAIGITPVVLPLVLARLMCSVVAGDATDEAQPQLVGRFEAWSWLETHLIWFARMQPLPLPPEKAWARGRCHLDPAAGVTSHPVVSLPSLR